MAETRARTPNGAPYCRECRHQTSAKACPGCGKNNLSTGYPRCHDCRIPSVTEDAVLQMRRETPELNQSTIAMRVGKSKQRVSQILRRARATGTLTNVHVITDLNEQYVKRTLAYERENREQLACEGVPTEQLTPGILKRLLEASPITNLLVERVVTDELGRPDSRAVEALRRVVSSRFGERVSGQVVVSAIHRVMTKMITGETKTAMTSQTEAQSGLSVSKDTTSPVVRRSELVGSAGESLQQDNPLSAKAAGAKRITLADLVEAGVLPSDATLTATVRGVTHTAFLRNAMLEVDGREYSTPSAASIAVRNVRSWNGWNDWRYQGQSLHDLRERLGTSLNTPRGGE